jgi:hypothetical protein
MIARLRAVVADPSVRWLAAARVLSLLAAPLTLYLLVTRQPVSARGFYLIAINVVTLAQLFETGMGTMVVQFATHVRPSERGTLRAAADQWFRRAATVILALGATAGTIIMIRGAESASVNFLAPWAVVLVTTATYVALVPLVCLRESGGDVEGVQRMRAVQAVLMAAAMVGGLWRGGNIGAAALAGVAQLAAVVWYLARGRRHVPAPDVAAGRLAEQYRTEQGKSARVWVALWIAPQLLTPSTMLVRGASDAGHLGLHVALALAPPMLAVAWLHARYPRLGALVASGALRTFDETAWHAFRQAAGVYGAVAGALLVLALGAPYVVPFLAGGVLSLPILAALLVGSFVLVAMQAMLAWFRAFADEKFAMPVVVGCGAMATAGVFGAAVGGATGAAVAYALVGAIVAGILCVGFMRLRAQRLAGA